jgi:hypothetical protein
VRTWLRAWGPLIGTLLCSFCLAAGAGIAIGRLTGRPLEKPPARICTGPAVANGRQACVDILPGQTIHIVEPECPRSMIRGIQRLGAAAR